MGYTIRDYVLDSISEDIIKLENEYELEIITENSGGDFIELSIKSNFMFVNYLIGFDEKLNHFYENMKELIEENFTQCECCEKGKETDSFVSDEFTNLLVCSNECGEKKSPVEYENGLANY